jgi:hypothetical protein
MSHCVTIEMRTLQVGTTGVGIACLLSIAVNASAMEKNEEATFQGAMATV